MVHERLTPLEAHELAKRTTKHRRMLAEIQKGTEVYRGLRTLDNGRPRSLDLHRNRNKRARGNREDLVRQREIERENTRLVQRMAQILHEGTLGPHDKSQVSMMSSRKPAYVVEAEAKRNETELFFRRIHQTQPVYSAAAWRREYRINVGYIRKLKRFQQRPPGAPRQHGPNSAKSEVASPKSEQESVWTAPRATRPSPPKGGGPRRGGRAGSRLRQPHRPPHVRQAGHGPAAPPRTGVPVDQPTKAPSANAVQRPKGRLPDHIVVKHACRLGGQVVLLRFAWIGSRKEIEISLFLPRTQQTSTHFLDPQQVKAVAKHFARARERGSMLEVVHHCARCLKCDSNGHLVVALDHVIRPKQIVRELAAVDRESAVQATLPSPRSIDPGVFEAVRQALSAIAIDPHKAKLHHAVVKWDREMRRLELQLTSANAGRCHLVVDAGFTDAHSANGQHIEAAQVFAALAEFGWQ